MSEDIFSKSKVIVILGPTSSGKSDVAISLAKKFSGEVISADSRQVYRDMDLGTGKVEGTWKKINDKSEDKAFFSEGIAHHLLDFRSPRGEYNVAQFKKDCEKKLFEISARGKVPIICGGTGFWISAVVDGTILPEVKPNQKLRKDLEQEPAEQLFAKLKKLAPQRAQNIDIHNKIRLIRALEIFHELGEIPQVTKQDNPNFDFLQVGIDWPQEKLDEKIKRRLNGRWQAGMVDETTKLKERYRLSWKRIQSFGLGYVWIPLFIQKKIDRDELRKRVFIAERGYAKRQKTWFARDKRIKWETDLVKIELLTEDFLEKI